MNGHNDGSNKRFTAEEDEEPSHNKRIKNSPTPRNIPRPDAQLSMMGAIKTKYSSGTGGIKVAKGWYAAWEAYCLQLYLSHPPPVYLADDDDENPDNFVLLPPRAVQFLRSWYGGTKQVMELKLNTAADHSTSNTQKTTFEQKKPNNSAQRTPATPTPRRKRPGYSAMSDDESDNDDNGTQKGPELHFKVYIIDKPVSTCNYSFTLSADASVFDFQSNLLNALNIHPSSSGTVPISDLWLLNHENASFKNILDTNAAFTLKRSLMENSDRYAQKIDSSSIAPDATISSCLSRLSSSSSSRAANSSTYLLAVELIRNRPNSSPFSTRVRTAAAKAPLPQLPLGLHGLQNLGNTCYMNSALQCLSNTPQLTRYFLSEQYRRDINRSNPLGLDGDLAEAYAKLIKDIWTPSTSYSTRRSGSISPENFKSTFERFSPHFIGYLQQDSQELLAFLLDGLHEDLNRVLEKPYIEIPDFDDHIKNEEIADKFWSYHKSRNDSIIVDLFQGQYKSRLVCGECKKLLVTEIYFQKIHRIFRDRDRIRSIRPSDAIYVYELPCPSTEQDNEDWIVFPVYCSTTLDQQNPLSVVTSIPQFGLPIVLAIEAEKLKDPSYLYSTIAQHMERYCILKLFEEDKLAPSSPPVPDTAATDADAPLPHAVQQPIHTTAAVIPAGGRPMVPMPNLFKIHVFEYKNSSESFTFPVGESQLHWYDDDAQASLKQGRGVLIEWPTVKAQQFFGTKPSTNEINPEAWYDCDRDEQSAISNDNTTSSGYNTRYSSSSSRHRGSRAITLNNCLDEFTGDEHLDDQDSWYCPRCKKHQRALKKMDIWKLPEIMVVHLKRFSQVRHWGNKVDTMIDFPLKELDMTDRVLGHQDESLIYDLYAVDNHYGGMGGGHYTAFAQNIEDGEWYEFNDSSVTAMSDKDVKTSAAYLLFYKRRS
ncbi:hypothetical protein MBANPS3_007173 [Mucor bainieri]